MKAVGDVAPGDSGPAWHALSVDEVLGRLQTSPEGLSDDQAAKRLLRHGANRLKPSPSKGIPRRFLSQLANALIYVLIGSAVITALLGEWTETAVILGVVVVNALIGVIQEGRAEKALAAIRSLLAPTAIVERDGRRRELAFAEVVPGDIVFLRAGDRVPADVRVLRSHGLQVQESALTGEAEAVTKTPEPVDKDAALGDRSSMAYAGSLVTAGTGSGAVVATGEATEFGRIASLLGEIQPLTTPLLQQMTAFGRALSLATLALAACTFLFGWLFRGYPLADMLVAAVSLAVAAIPEGLPAIMTIALTVGVTRMARRNAIIRQLPAVETLGAATVICSDKTGTLTLNEMTAKRVTTTGATYEVEGSGYAPEGRIRREGQAVDAQEQPDLIALVRAGVLCNDADIALEDGSWWLAGSPTDGALLTLGLKAGLCHRAEREACPGVARMPFDSVHKFMASVQVGRDGHSFVIVKGAPERVIDMCRWQRHAGAEEPIEHARWLASANGLAADAFRVLAVAQGETEGFPSTGVATDSGGELSLLGLVGLIDPPRPEAREAVARCLGAGIEVKMMTGDHAATAEAVAAWLGFVSARAVTGQELDRMDEAVLSRVVREASVFARTTPAHKLRLIEALQAQGQVVAMTGDGVNDAPALKRADIGIAMGRKGTEAAKEAAAMVLADDRFVSIADAVEEGRIVYDNLIKAVVFVLPTNVAQAFLVLAAILLGQTLPVTPVQVLWVNMVSAVTLGVALAFEPGEPGLMQRRPRRRDAPILSAFVVWRALYVSLLFLVACFGLFEAALARGVGLAAARTLTVNALIAGEIVYLLSVSRLDRHVLAGNRSATGWAVPLSIAALVLLQLGLTYLPAMHALFETAPIDGTDWARVAIVALLMLACLELEKHVLRQWKRRPTPLERRGRPGPAEDALQVAADEQAASATTRAHTRPPGAAR